MGHLKNTAGHMQLCPAFCVGNSKGKRASPSWQFNNSSGFAAREWTDHTGPTPRLTLYLWRRGVPHQNGTDAEWGRRGLLPENGETGSLPHILPTLEIANPTFLLWNSSIISFYGQILILIRLLAYPNRYFIIKSPETEAIKVVPQKGCSVK